MLTRDALYKAWRGDPDTDPDAELVSEYEATITEMTSTPA